MKMMRVLIIVFAAIMLVQCSKDKDDNGVNLTKGLLAVFKLNNEFNDSTGNIPITLYTNTGITAVADRKGNAKSAMSFDEGYMYATVDGWSANLITIACWVLPKNNTNDNFFLRADGAAFGFFQYKDAIGFTISTPATNTAKTSFGTGWIHLTGTYDGKDIRTYINGELAATLNHPGEPGSVSKIEAGSFNSPYWKGAIDELRFYNRLLSEEEIALLAKL